VPRRVASPSDALEQKRAEWLRELEYRQRNIVFPETAMNGGHFWRHLAYAKYPLNTIQKIGVIVLLFTSGIPYMVFLGASSILHALLGTSAREPAYFSGMNALVFFLSQILTIAVMLRVLASTFTRKKGLADFRGPLRRGSIR